jgi:hypothetical protein
MLKTRLEPRGGFEVLAAEDSEKGCRLWLNGKPPMRLQPMCGGRAVHKRPRRRRPLVERQCLIGLIDRGNVRSSRIAAVARQYQGTTEARRPNGPNEPPIEARNARKL